MARLYVFFLCVIFLSSCDYGARLSDLESKQDSHSSQLASLTDKVSSLEAQVSSLAAKVNGSSNIKIKVGPGNSWQTLYANSTGRSQMVRATHLAGDSASDLMLRAQPIKGEPSIPGDDSSPPIGSSPEWDMSAIGAQRWIRLACGLEIRGRAQDTQQVVSVLVSADPNPVSCDQ